MFVDFFLFLILEVDRKVSTESNERKRDLIEFEESIDNQNMKTFFIYPYFLIYRIILFRGGKGKIRMVSFRVMKTRIEKVFNQKIGC